MRRLPTVVVIKNQLRHLMVLMTVLFGLMLTSCGGGGGSGSQFTHTFELPSVPTMTVAWNSGHDANTEVSWFISSINAPAAYALGYFGQSVTIAFIDEGLRMYTAADGGYLQHHAFGGAGSSDSRLTKVARISGSITSTVVSSIDIYNNNHWGQAAMGIAAGQLVESSAHSLTIQFGVAISSTLMPIDIVDGDYELDSNLVSAVNYAVDNGAQIMFYGVRTDNTEVHITVSYDSKNYSVPFQYSFPILSTLNRLGIPLGVFTAQGATILGAKLENEDIAFVVGTGINFDLRTSNVNAWNSVQGTMTLTGLAGVSNTIIAMTTFVNQVTIDSFGIGRTLITVDGIDEKASEFFGEDGANLPFGFIVAFPLFDARLQSKFVVVVGTNRNGTIDLNNGCGAHKHWCVSAPSTRGARVPGGYPDGHGQQASGHNVYAPAVVAGALAVVKSRMPDLPVSAARAVLFTTATKTGFTGVSPVYGHGLINVGAAMSLVGQISVVAPTQGSPTSSHLLVNSSIVLSPSFQNFQQQVSNISMAVDVLGNGFYFDSPFSSVMNDDAIQNQVMTLGFAAGDMDTTEKHIGGLDIQINRKGNLANFGFKRKQGLLNYSLCAKCKNSVWDEYAMEYEPLPFFADTKRKLQGGWSLGDSIDTFVVLGLDEDNEKDKYAQYGINWKGVQLGEWELAGSFSRIQEQRGYLLGSEFSGAFALGESSSTQLGLRAQRYIEGWRMFGAVDYGKTQTDTINNSLIRRIQGLSYAGWRLGLDKDSVFRDKDKVHFGITKVPSVISGSMDLELSQTTGDTAYDDNLAMDYLNKTEFRKHRINLDDSDAFVYRLGYSTNIHKRQRLALGFEHYTDKTNEDNTAISAQYRFEF